ncbi:MAG TPA: hypothetical protein VK187_00935 [Geobacteraceae bacterium]|nr:hypothetical protein [Geobacteraceae bacterium]
MAQKVTLKVSAMVAAYVRPEAAKGDKLKAARGEVPLRAGDLGALLFFLSRDRDPDVRSAALGTLRGLPVDLLVSIAASPETPPLVLDALARVHFDKDRVVTAILTHPEAEERTLEFLVAQGVDISSGLPAGSGPDKMNDSEEEAHEEEPGEESEEALSKYKLLQLMSIGEKVKMAMLGDKEWRSLLIKDTNKIVSTAVIKNPRITEPEILAMAKSSELNEEIIRLICMNKDWIKVYPIRKALVENSKTMLPKALRFLATLNEKDIAALAKSKNISSVLARQAQRIMLTKKK